MPCKSWKPTEENPKDIFAQIFNKASKPPSGDPHGWLQWKGSNVCIDFHCACGHHSHIDADFVYYIRCPKCKQTYSMNPNIEAIPLNVEETQYVLKNSSMVIHEDSSVEEEIQNLISQDGGTLIKEF